MTKILDWYLEFIILLGQIGGFIVGLVFLHYGYFPVPIEELNAPLITFVLGWLFFESLFRIFAKLATWSDRNAKKKS